MLLCCSKQIDKLRRAWQQRSARCCGSGGGGSSHCGMALYVDVRWGAVSKWRKELGAMVIVCVCCWLCLRPSANIAGLGLAYDVCSRGGGAVRAGEIWSLLCTADACMQAGHKRASHVFNAERVVQSAPPPPHGRKNRVQSSSVGHAWVTTLCKGMRPRCFGPPPHGSSRAKG